MNKPTQAFIVKVQKSLFSNDGSSILIYDYSKTIFVQFPLTPELDKEIKLEKEYRWAEIIDGEVNLYKNEIKDFQGMTPEEQFEKIDFLTMNGN